MSASRLASFALAARHECLRAVNWPADSETRMSASCLEKCAGSRLSTARQQCLPAVWRVLQDWQRDTNVCQLLIGRNTARHECLQAVCRWAVAARHPAGCSCRAAVNNFRCAHRRIDIDWAHVLGPSARVQTRSGALCCKATGDRLFRLPVVLWGTRGVVHHVIR